MSAPTHRLSHWRNAVFVIFGLSGTTIASWAARLPAARDALHITPGVVGLLSVCISIGAILGLVTTGWASARFGYRTGMAGSIIASGLGLACAGIGATLLGSIPLVVIGLVLLGFGNGCVDVMMNVSGASVERRIGRTLMPFMHACFSIGTVVGAALGAAAAALGVPVQWHLLVVGVIVTVGIVIAVRFVPDRLPGDGATTDAAGAASAAFDPFDDPGIARRIRAAVATRLAVWRDLTLVLIGVVMLGMAFAEGSATDWIALAAVDGHGVDKPSAAAILDIFMVAMTLGRIAGGPLVDRIGRVWAIRITGGLAVIGLLAFILGTAPWLYVAGVVLWGLGASLGFPLGMSAAADDERNATARVSSVAMIGYLAFLAGPPFIGFLGDHVGLLDALFVVLVLVAAAFLCAPALKPRHPHDSPLPAAEAG